MTEVMYKVMMGQVKGKGGHEVEVVYDVLIGATFAPLHDLTAYELAQARAVIGEYRVFHEREWDALQLAQRHWKRRSSGLGPGYIQHHSNGED